MSISFSVFGVLLGWGGRGDMGWSEEFGRVRHTFRFSLYFKDIGNLTLNK